MSYLSDASARRTSQSEKIPGRPEQVENRAGGFVFAVDDWTRLDRFLILGTEGGTYYASQHEMTKENAECVFRCVREDGRRTVRRIVEISDSGRAPRNTEALFALAVASVAGDELTRRMAFDVLPEVARIGTHLFQFAGFREQLGGGWGRGMKRAVQDWYQREDLERVAYQAVKYRQREGWSHTDLLRLSKPVPVTDSHQRLYEWIVGKAGTTFGLPPIVEGYEMAQVAKSPRVAADLVRKYKLPREALKTEHLKSPEVQEAMLFEGGKYGMPIGALIRNLANMTRSGLLTPTSDATRKVVEMLNAEKLLKHARIHPINVLIAMKTYESGRGLRGTNTWEPIPQIVDALDDAFYLAFDNVEPTNKRFLIGLDVSGSMTREVMGVPGLSAREVAAAMALVIAKTEPAYECVAFTGGSRGYSYGFGRHSQSADMVSAFPLSSRQRLDDVVRKTEGLPFGGTDCALPMLYAQANDREVDAFLIITDNESWAGSIHPSQALAEYRRASGIGAKMVAMAVTATDYSVADPHDAGMLDAVGFDAAVPQVVADFIRD